MMQTKTFFKFGLEETTFSMNNVSLIVEDNLLIEKSGIIVLLSIISWCALISQWMEALKVRNLKFGKSLYFLNKTFCWKNNYRNSYKKIEVPIFLRCYFDLNALYYIRPWRGHVFDLPVSINTDGQRLRKYLHVTFPVCSDV